MLAQDTPQTSNVTELGKVPTGTPSAWQVPTTVVYGKLIELYRSLVTLLLLTLQ